MYSGLKIDRPNLLKIAVCEKDRRPISLSRSVFRIWLEAMWAEMIFPHLIAFSLDSEIRSRFPLRRFGNSPNIPRNVRAWATLILPIFKMTTSVAQKQLKVERPGLDSESGGISP